MGGDGQVSRTPPTAGPRAIAALALAAAGRPVARWARPAPLPALRPRRLDLGRGLAVWRLPVGFVRVRLRHRELEPELRAASDAARFPLMMADRRLTEWLPCSAWLIEHPEGPILVDTGASPSFGTPDWTGAPAPVRRLYPRIIDCRTPPGHDLPAQVAAAGLSLADLRLCVLTHLHSDHVDNAALLDPRTRLLVSERELSPGGGRLPGRLPGDGRARRLEALSAVDDPVFGTAWPLTRGGDVAAVPLPGHTPGHVGVAITTPRTRALIAGDAAFDGDQLRRGGLPGINESRAETERTHARLRAWAALGPGLLLFSHDPGGPAGLAAA